MTTEIPILRARVGQTHLALELGSLVSLLEPDQVEGIEIVGVAGVLGQPYAAPRAVALLNYRNASIALGLDEIAGYEQWDATRVAPLPRWLAQHLPDILKPACGLGDDGEIVWILHPPAFVETHLE